MSSDFINRKGVGFEVISFSNFQFLECLKSFELVSIIDSNDFFTVFPLFTKKNMYRSLMAQKIWIYCGILLGDMTLNLLKSIFRQS